jgi:hypothetical protein
MRSSAFLALPLAASALFAQSVVVPNANATVAGTSGLNTIVRNSGAPRTYMMGINAAELAAIPVGDVIVGVSYRQYFGATTPWPPTDAPWTDYEISVGACIPTASWTATFATNFAGTPTLARDGAMLLPAGTYTAGSPVNAWGDFFFDLQTPVPYLGGDLGILMTHPGSTLTTNCFLETVPVNAAAHGVSFSATTFQAASGVSAAFYITRVHYGYGTGCPGTGGRTPVLVQNENTSGGAGGTIKLAVANAPANAGALMVLGFGRATTPLPNGCTLLVPPGATAFFFLGPNGTGTQTITVPPGITATFNAQCLVLDAGATGGFTMTNAVEPSAL